MKFTKIGAYKLRNGQKQMVEAVLSDGTLVGLRKPGYTRSWCADGLFQPDSQSAVDIISEWVEPDPIPWTREEVPHGALFRRKRDPDGRWGVASWVEATRLHLAGTGRIELQVIATDYEHSTDGGITWLPCHKAGGAK